MKRFGVIILTVVTIISVFTVSAFADTYDYNDVYFYVDNQLLFKGSLTSDSIFSDYIYFDFARDVDNGHLIYKAQGGSWHDSGHFYPNVNEVSGSQTSYADVNIAYVTSQGNPYWHVSNITPPNLSNDVYIYMTTIQTKLPAPVVTVNSNTGYIQWNSVTGAVSYSIYYSATSQGTFSEIITTTYNNYYPTQSGYYYVRANSSNYFYNSDFSNKISFTYDPGNNEEGLLSWIISRVQTLVFNIKAFFSEVANLTNEVGNVFSNLTAFLPDQYAGTLWALAGLMLIFGLFRLF